MRRSLMTLAIAALLALASGTPARAATLEIHFTGLNLVFNGTEIVDATSPLGGVGDPSEADPLATMAFFVDNVLVGSLTSDIYADVAIFGVEPLPVGGGVVEAQGGGFDLLTSSLGFGLALALDQVTLLYTGGQIALFGASAVVEVIEQSLPFGLTLGQPIQVLFELGTLTNVTDDGTFLTGFSSSGTGSIAGMEALPVPEPATLLLFGTGLIGVGIHLRRRLR